MFSVDDEILKPNEIDNNPYTELKLTEHSIELLSYPIEPEEFNEINKINGDTQALEDATRTETKDQLNDNFKDLKITETTEIENTESENDFDEEDDEPEKPTDIDFLIYKNNLLNDPDHVIRYCFHPKTLPMYYSLFGKFDSENIADCEVCGSKRVFEFQVNNTLLNGVEEISEMDWGIIVVYSCVNSCFVEDKAFVGEVVKVQREVYDTRDFKTENKEEADSEEKPQEKKKSKKKKPKKKKAKKNEGNEFNADSWA